MLMEKKNELQEIRVMLRSPAEVIFLLTVIMLIIIENFKTIHRLQVSSVATGHDKDYVKQVQLSRWKSFKKYLFSIGSKHAFNLF